MMILFLEAHVFIGMAILKILQILRILLVSLKKVRKGGTNPNSEQFFPGHQAN